MMNLLTLLFGIPPMQRRVEETPGRNNRRVKRQRRRKAEQPKSQFNGHKLSRWLDNHC